MYVKLLDPSVGEPCNPAAQGSTVQAATASSTINSTTSSVSAPHRGTSITAKMAAFSVHAMDKNWEFKQADKDDASFLPVAQFPTMVHLDLLAHGLISDPNIGKNELDCQWVGEKVWTYRTKFVTPKDLGGNGEKAVLAFDGLDTFATVVLNGKTILETDNMFILERVDVTKNLSKEGGDNELVITFDSAYLRGCKLVEEYPDHVWGCWNGDNSRLAVRKSQYHWVSIVKCLAVWASWRRVCYGGSARLM